MLAPTEAPAKILKYAIQISKYALFVPRRRVFRITREVNEQVKTGLEMNEGVGQDSEALCGNQSEGRLFLLLPLRARQNPTNLEAGSSHEQAEDGRHKGEFI